MAVYLLFELASGYCLLKCRRHLDEIGQNLEAVRKSVGEIDRFSRIVKYVAYEEFESARVALNQLNAVSEGQMTDELQNFLEVNLPKLKKRKEQKFSVGVADPKLGSHIHELTSIPCQSNEFVLEMLRGVRLHIDWFLKSLKPRYLEKVQLGLGHSYSRGKVKFNVNRADNMVIQAIRHLDTLDKDVNLFSMRVREWYSCHFPELASIVNDNYLYAKVAEYVANKSQLSKDKLPGLVDLVGDEIKASEIIEAAKVSMGQDLSHVDLINVKLLAQRVIILVEDRKKLNDYLVAKMRDVAPTLAALIGEVIGARLILHAGSLMNLAKSPSSTIQILGAKKALFRALITHGNMPKYGLIFHSSLIGRASDRNKGRVARILANKCAIAARVDCFSENNTTDFGVNLRKQVEERLNFYERPEPLTKKRKISGSKPLDERRFSMAEGKEEIIIQEFKEGNPKGNQVRIGSQVGVRYTCMLGLEESDIVFHTNVGDVVPFRFFLGCVHVIRGWDFVVGGMRVGGRRRIIIPSCYGHGTENAPWNTCGKVIPRCSGLVIDVEVVEVGRYR